MKLIEKGLPIPDITNGWEDVYTFVTKDALLADITYLTEHRIEKFPLAGILKHTVTILGKKQDFMCGDCGSKFISHKGLCADCYMRQL